MLVGTTLSTMMLPRWDGPVCGTAAMSPYQVSKVVNDHDRVHLESCIILSQSS